QCLAMVRKWSNERVQWGAPIGKHEAVASKMTKIAAQLFAMESITWLTSNLLDKGVKNVKSEAAAAKLYASETAWEIGDLALQIRGGRGYETATSLKNRGDFAFPMERMLREVRINRIIEGTSEIMKLLLARELVDLHMKIAGKMMLPKTPIVEKIKIFAQATLFYMTWYPRQWINTAYLPFKHLKQGKFAKDFRYVEAKAHEMARTIFQSMAIHQIKLEKKELLLGRLVDIAVELFAISATVSRALNMMKNDKENAKAIYATAKTYIDLAKEKINSYFEQIYINNDAKNYKYARKVLDGEMKWMEDGVVPIL
ncbi:MAG: DNA polymerase II, partial [Candidatus Margulisbacteria bacterium]|nr:DNA polymerase II [Candidatus Margulisiibacteriota bacterium]